MLNSKVEDALNEHINAEFWSAYLYLSMSAYLESENLQGFANWMRVQWQEEKDHGTNNMLQWFVSEQVEEEAHAENILMQLRMIESKGQGMLMLDRELAQRVFTDPTKA